MATRKNKVEKNFSKDRIFFVTTPIIEDVIKSQHDHGNCSELTFSRDTPIVGEQTFVNFVKERFLQCFETVLLVGYDGTSGAQILLQIFEKAYQIRSMY